MDVNSARLTLFTRMSRNIDNNPPTKAALEEHIKRAVCQAGHIWGQTLQLQPLLPSPSDWGWEKVEDNYKPKWTTLPVAENACQELTSCKCKKSCRGNCKFYKMWNGNIRPICTPSCKCGGTCFEI